MATCRGAAAQLSQAGERGREQGARPRSRFPPFDIRRHATCTPRAHSCSNLPKCGVFCMLSLGELPRVPDRSTGGTGGARCTTVRASGPYLRYGYRRFAPYHVLVHSAHPYRVGPGSAGRFDRLCQRASATRSSSTGRRALRHRCSSRAPQTESLQQKQRAVADEHTSGELFAELAEHHQD